jgi:NADPH:quinone reductase-like Zn-dependent oxidoreductase
MKAVVQTRFGAPEEALVLTEIGRPEPGPDEVLVRMRATSVNTPDWVAVTGVPYAIRPQARRELGKAVRGTDIAGVVEATGANVTHFKRGDEVFGARWTNVMPTRGTFAEYTVTPVELLAPMPKGVTFEEAAASVMSGVTALIALREVYPVREGARVLINGASGGVGTFAVQLAKAAGAEVTAVCGPTNVDLVRELGADHVIDYTVEDFTEIGAYDAILDNVMNHPPRRTIRALARGGVLMPNSIGNTGGVFAGLTRMGQAALLGLSRRADVRFVRGEHTSDRLIAMAELLESGKVKAVIDKVYSLEDTPKAVAHMAGHHAKGNVVITFDS